MEKQSDAPSTTESTEETAVTEDGGSFEAFEEPTGAQLQEAQREMERALKDMKNKSAGDSTLSRYFREMANHPVLTPQQEVEAAKEVERLEIGYWKALFSYAPAFETTALVLEQV
ncbi:MAG: sigma-70 factor domain-containing protein, partial [Polyangiales bacterium]